MKYAFALTLCALTLAACTAEEEVSYDQNSWQTMISDDCTAFFDGCNNCRRELGSNVAACTKKFCREYKEPMCLDNE